MARKKINTTNKILEEKPKNIEIIKKDETVEKKDTISENKVEKIEDESIQDEINNSKKNKKQEKLGVCSLELKGKKITNILPIVEDGKRVIPILEQNKKNKPLEDIKKINYGDNNVKMSKISFDTTGKKLGKCVLLGTGMNLYLKPFNYKDSINYSTFLNNITTSLRDSINDEYENYKEHHVVDASNDPTIYNNLYVKFTNKLYLDKFERNLNIIYNLIEIFETPEGKIDPKPSFEDFTKMVKFDDLPYIYATLYFLNSEDKSIPRYCSNENCVSDDGSGEEKRTNYLEKINISEIMHILNTDISKQTLLDLISDKTMLKSYLNDRKKNKIYDTYNKEFEIKFENSNIIKATFKKPSIHEILTLMKTVIYHTNFNFNTKDSDEDIIDDIGDTSYNEERELFNINLANLTKGFDLSSLNIEDLQEQKNSMFFLKSLINSIEVEGVDEDGNVVYITYRKDTDDEDFNFESTKMIFKFLNNLSIKDEEALLTNDYFFELATYKPIKFYLPQFSCKVCGKKDYHYEIIDFELFFFSELVDTSTLLSNKYQALITKTTVR